MVPLDRYRHDSSTGLNYLYQTPALGLGERASFLDSHPVAYFGFALLVVRVKLLVASDHFLIPAMRKAALDPNNNGFGHLVGDNLAQALFALGPSGIRA